MEMRDEILRFYEQNAAEYARQAAEDWDPGSLKAFCEQVVKAHEQSSGGHSETAPRILDAGCGAGRDLNYFKEAGFEAEGFDGSSALVEIATRESGPKVWRADFRMLSLPKESYDGIWAYRSLIHLPPEGCQRAMASFFSALRPGGILLVAFDFGEALKTEPKTYQHSGEAMASWLKQGGFAVISAGENPRAPERKIILARRL